MTYKDKTLQRHLAAIVVLLLLMGCKNTMDPQEDRAEEPEKVNIKSLLEINSQKIITAAKTKSFAALNDLYNPESLLLTDYNPLIIGKKQIKRYYDTIFKRQDIKTYEREIIDVLEFTNRVIEIGVFNKTFENTKELNGKYFNVWKKDTAGKLTLRAEAFGYFERLEDPTIFLVPEASVVNPKAIKNPRELQAYAELGKSNVRARVPERTADSYTDDAMYFPFADSLKKGKEVLINHYKGYYQHPATIDSIEVMTYAYDTLENGYIKYGGFYVDWSVPGYSGTSTGTGISYWLRGKDHSLRIHRQIGLHIHQ